MRFLFEYLSREVMSQPSYITVSCGIKCDTIFKVVLLKKIYFLVYDTFAC